MARHVGVGDLFRGEGLTKEAIKAGTVTTSDGGHHFSFMENPERFNEILAEFICSSGREQK